MKIIFPFLIPICFLKGKEVSVIRLTIDYNDFFENVFLVVVDEFPKKLHPCRVQQSNEIEIMTKWLH